MKKLRMATPGPTQVPSEILLAGAKEVIHHRSLQMETLVEFTNKRLMDIYQTEYPVYTMLSSGTGAMEASISNCFNRGDKVLIVYNGYWGERFLEISKSYGLEIVLIESPWGEPVDTNLVAEFSHKHPDAAGILVTYSETSTGVLNDVQTIGEIFRNTSTIVIVDAISALITHPLPMDFWGLDVVLAASHKGFMMPPGLAFVGVSPKAWQRIESCSSPNYYFSLRRYRKFYPMAPSSPGVSLLLALKRSVDMLEQEGPQAIIERQLKLATATNAALCSLGFQNVVKLPQHRNHVITVAETPVGISPKNLLEILDQDHGVTITGGQGIFKDKVIRFGHIGAMDFIDLHGLFSAIESSLISMGHNFRPGAAAQAIHEVIHAKRIGC